MNWNKSIGFLTNLFLLYSVPLFAWEHFVEVEFIYQNKSHQNPWQTNEPIRHKANAIQIDTFQFFALGLAREVPIQEEVQAYSGANFWKMKIRKYDPATGFALLELLDKKNAKPYHLNFPKNHSECNLIEPRYVQLSFSPIPIKAYKKSLSAIRSEYIVIGNLFCGISIGQYSIPVEYIQFFINSKDQSPFPHPGFEFESLLNASEKSFYFPGKRKGILVTKVYPGVGPSHSLIPGDAIYAINGVPLEQFSENELGEKVFDLILRKNNKILPINTPVQLSFRRMGQDRTVRYQLRPYHESQFLIPETHPDRNPPYLIVGGLFFTELTGEYLKESGEDYRNKVDMKLLFLYENFQTFRYPHRDRVVILSRVFPHPLNEGYHNFQDLILESLNGRKIRNIRDLKNTLSLTKDNYLVFSFSENKEIILTKTDANRIDFELTGNFKLKSMDNIPP